MKGVGSAGVIELFFYYESKFNIMFLFVGAWGRGARVSNFFQRIQIYKKIYFFFVCVCGRGGGWGGG